MIKLFHYTCSHAATLIDAAGVLRPNPASTWMPEPLVWASDLKPGDVPDLDLALGLRGAYTGCDRTEHRFEVLDPGAFEPWMSYARGMVRAGRLDREVRRLLDSTPGGFPRHWWVSTEPVGARIAG